MGQAVTKLSCRLALLVALLALPPGVFAHRLDEYLQATLVAIEPGGIRLEINLTPGVAVAEQVLALIDRDRDGVISTNEAAAYGELLRRDLNVQLDQRHVELKLTASNMPEMEELRGGVGIIQMEFTLTSGALPAGQHKLTVENRHLPGASVYLFNAARPRTESVRIARQKRNQNQSTGEIVFDFHPPPNPSMPAGVAVSLAALSVALFAGVWQARKKAISPSVIVIFAAVLLLGGCATKYNQSGGATAIGITPLPAVSKGYFAVGSSMDEVTSVMGAPVRIAHPLNEVWWYYGDSRVVFRDGMVFGWDNSSNNLKVRGKAPTPIAGRVDVVPPPAVPATPTVIPPSTVPAPAAVIATPTVTAPSTVTPRSTATAPSTALPSSTATALSTVTAVPTAPAPSAVSAPSTVTESPKVVPPPQDTEARQIDAQVTAILARQHSPLPPAVMVQADASASYAEIAVKNDTQHNLTVLFSGPTPRNAVVLANGTLKLVLAAGTYRVAATGDNSAELPFAGSQEFHGGNYQDTFRFEASPK